MKLYINYDNNKTYIHTSNFQSIKSITYQYLSENKIDNEVDDFYMDYNGLHLDNNLSIEKYNISENYTLNLNKKTKGGNSFMSYASKNPLRVVICLLIALLPLIILPMGFISATASLIKVIIEKSMSSIEKYLICNLGKITLCRRIRFIIFLIKYTIFFLMIFVIITLPLLILCITLKGHSILDNPKDMCSALSAGNIAGTILTMLFILIYCLHRCGNFIINFLISLCKKVYFLNATFVPILKSILSLYDEIKYMPTIIITFGLVEGYFAFLGVLLEGIEMVLTTITELGCKTQFAKDSFIKKLTEKMNNAKCGAVPKCKEDKKEEENIEKPEVKNICKDDMLKCCNIENYIDIGDLLYNATNVGMIANDIKRRGLYPAFILMIEAFYEGALFKLQEDGNGRSDEVKGKLYNLEQSMIAFSIKDKSQYIQGKTLFKTIFKSMFLDIFCNITTTTKTSKDVITEMGEINEITDMLKAGTSTGIYMSIIYFISYIVIFFCGIFNVF